MRKEAMAAVLTVLLTAPAWANMGLPVPRPPTTVPSTEPGTQPAPTPKQKAANTPLGFAVSGLLVTAALVGGGLLLARSRRGQ